ncbi:MAG: hypothetical protein SFY81_13820 [Verrucomicrobiota bacterium]|nr:hypothetical protein [Verrucomicrobiota bacterium]
MKPYAQLDIGKVKVFPLVSRRSLSEVNALMVDPEAPLQPISENSSARIRDCADKIREAIKRRAAVMLIYGAHLVKNGASLIVQELIRSGAVNHLATNGAGTIHDWEFAWFGQSTESVADNVLTGTFGTWDETSRNIHIALLAGGTRGEGYGQSLGRLIHEEGVEIPPAAELSKLIVNDPNHPLTAARAELLAAINDHRLPSGWYALPHRWKGSSILGEAARLNVPLTVHPGIGYDIISNHPMFNGGAIGRAAGIDFKVFGAAVSNLDGGVVLSVGSAIMGPQVFEKSLSCVNNLRIQRGEPIIRDHSIYVVDLQDGGNWDWTRGEPPKDNPAYYLRFCKSFSRMGGAMHYLQCDNLAFLHHLYQELKKP